MNFKRLTSLTDRLALNLMGEPISLVGQGRVIQGVFDLPNAVEQLGGIASDLDMPTITVRESDLAGVAERDLILVGGNNYLAVWPPKSDGAGMVVLGLVIQQASNPKQGGWR